MSSHPLLYVKHALHSTICSQVVKVPREFIVTPNISDDSTFIVLNHGTHIRFYELTGEGMNVFKDYSVNCVVSSVSFVTFRGKPHLLILTFEKDIFLMKWSTNDLEIAAHGNVADITGRLSRHGDKLRTFSPLSVSGSSSQISTGTSVLMSLYENTFKYLHFDAETSKLITSNLSINEPDMIDFVCLSNASQGSSITSGSPNTNNPLIAILYRDNTAKRIVKVYEFASGMGKLMPVSDLENVQVDPQANALLALPNGSLLVFGGKTIDLLPIRSGVSRCNTHFEHPTQVTASTPYSNDSVLLGTVHGKLFKLDINAKQDSSSLTLHAFSGSISTPNDIEYLGDGFAFVASICADSQIIRLEENETSFSLYDEFENIAPIMDAVLVDFDSSGQSAMITCSGKGKDGSLRLVVNGVGIESITETPVDDAINVFSLSSVENPESTQYLVLSFPQETMILGIDDSDLDKKDIGFDLSKPTIACGVTTSQKYVQVTKNRVILVNPGDQSIIAEWISQDEILVSSVYMDYIILSSGYNLVLLKATPSTLEVVSTTQRDNLVSCVNIRDGVCAVGSWNSYSVELLSVPGFMHIDSQILKEDIVPRSLLFATFEEVDYLLAGLGDGTLFYFTFEKDRIDLSTQKKMIIGTQPISLNSFFSNGENLAFASSDRSTIIFSQGKKLVFSNVNMQDVIALTTFNHEQVPNGLGIITSDRLVIGEVMEIQNIQVKKVPLNCQPVRIAHDPTSGTVGVLTVSSMNGEDVNHLKIFQEKTFTLMDSFLFERREYGSAISCLKLRNSEYPYYVVGTAFVHPEDREPRQGRIYVFEVQDARLRLVHKAEVNGAVYSLTSLKEQGLLLSAVNSRVNLWDWRDDRLVLQFTYTGQLLCQDIQTRGDFVCVRDLIRSITVLRYDFQKGELEEVGKDCTNTYSTAQQILDDEHFLVVDNSRNMIVMNRQSMKDESRKLGTLSRFHLGEVVNVIREGGLKGNLETPMMKVFTFGSANGSIGFVATMDTNQFLLFRSLEKAIEKHGGNSLGNIRHGEFRAFKARGKGVVASEGFIDGDYVESFLGIGPEVQEKIAAEIDSSVSHIISEIEKMIHSLI